MQTEVDPEAIVPGTFQMQWPPRSGQTQTFPEIDRVQWMPPDAARSLIVVAQAAFIDRLLDHTAQH